MSRNWILTAIIGCLALQGMSLPGIAWQGVTQQMAVKRKDTIARPGSQAGAQEKGADIKAFSAEYRKQLQQMGVAGSSVYLLHGGRLVHAEYYGMRDKEAKKPVDENTIYHWASITKTFTGIAIMQLRDKGLLKLTDPVTRYLPELRDVYDPFGSIDSITIWHLMTHTAGFRGSTWPWKEYDWQPYSPQYWSQLASMFPYTNIEFQPGSKWQYSNPGVVMLGRIIELLTHQDFEYYITKNILMPLGMESSYFDETPPHLLENLSHSYWIDSLGKTEPAIFNLNTGVTVSNGGLSASLPDMMKYVNFICGHADKRMYDYVLSKSSLEEMLQPQHKIVEERPYGSDQEWQGLIFFLEDIYGMRIAGHSGWQNGFQTHIYFDVRNDIAYIVAYNTAGRGARGLDDRIKDAVLKNFFIPLVKK